MSVQFIKDDDWQHSRATQDGGPCQFQHNVRRAASRPAKVGPLTRHRAFNSSVAAPSTPRKHGATALNVLGSPVLWANRYLIMDRVAALHLPAMYHRPKYRRKVVLPPNGPRDAQLLRDWLRRAFSLGFQAGEIAVFIPWRGRQPN